MQPIRTRHRLATCVTALLTVGALTACGQSAGGTSSFPSGAGSDTGTLTVAVVFPVTTLNPAKVGTDPTGIMTTQLAYEPLIRSDIHGATLPGLATSWEYVGKGNKQFDVTLRRDARFADGTPVTAQAVADSINYVVKSSTNPVVPATMSGAAAIGINTVRINAPTSNPGLPTLLGDLLVGSVISPTGLKTPDKLATATFGAGPYMLSAEQTTAGSRYTYVPNPNYYDPNRIHWDKIVFLQVESEAAALNALRSGQADVSVPISAGDVRTATTAGLAVAHAPSVFVDVVLADRAGTMVPALQDVRVRQALNYATDRGSIAKVVYGEYASTLAQTQLPGSDGYLSDPWADPYPYDPERAKRLLTEAGYPNGFSMTGLAVNVAGADKVATKVFDDWARIGVSVNARTEGPGEFYTDTMSKKYAVIVHIYGGLPTFFTSASFLRPIPGPFNPWGVGNPQVNRLLARGDAADDADRRSLYRQAMTLSIRNADSVPVLAIDAIVGSSRRVQGIAVSSVKNTPDLTLVTPAGP